MIQCLSTMKNLAWLTQKTEELKSNKIKETLLFPLSELM